MPDYDRTLVLQVGGDDETSQEEAVRFSCYLGAARLAQRKHGTHVEGTDENEIRTQLQALTRRSRLYIVGHSDGESLRVRKVGRVAPDAFAADYLFDRWGFRTAKVIYLVACNTGSPTDRPLPQPFVVRFAATLRGLHGKGVRFDEVRAPRGFVTVDIEGRKHVFSEIEGHVLTDEFDDNKEIANNNKFVVSWDNFTR